MSENLIDFVNAITELKIEITTLSLWCHCSKDNKQVHGCPHGMGGPKSKYYDGYFSEMRDQPFATINNNIFEISILS